MHFPVRKIVVRATVADVDAIFDCERAIDVAEHPHYVTSREEIEEDLGHSYVDLTLCSSLPVRTSNLRVGCLCGRSRSPRRRGIAPALLARTLEAVAAEGLEVAVLDVDAESPTANSRAAQ